MYRARWDESIDVQHQIFMIKTKSSYSFEDRGTDRRTEKRNRFWNVLSKTFEWYMTRLPKLKISLATRKTIYLPVTLGGGIRRNKPCCLPSIQKANRRLTWQALRTLARLWWPLRGSRPSKGWWSWWAGGRWGRPRSPLRAHDQTRAARPSRADGQNRTPSMPWSPCTKTIIVSEGMIIIIILFRKNTLKYNLYNLH